MRRRQFLASGGAAALALTSRGGRAATEQHMLYIAQPGIRNYVRYGGIGVLVYEASNGYRFRKRIPTWNVAAGAEPENVKGIAASARTGKLYVSTVKRVGCIDLLSEKMVWDKAFEGGCDRLSLSPDGLTLYVPSLEGPHWTVVEALTGAVITKVVTNSGSHNTVFGPDGTRVYLAGLHSPVLSIADARTHKVVKTVGPFSHVVRPFTINTAQTLCYVNVNDLLGFEIGDLRTGKKLHRVEVKNYQKGPVDRHGCPSHGVGLTPDGKELWLCDGHNSALHVFDNTVMPPRQMTSIKLRDQPGWITFSIDGKYAYPSTGEVFDTRSRKRLAALRDEQGREVGSEKQLEIVFANEKPIRAGDQFGVGGPPAAAPS